MLNKFTKLLKEVKQFNKHLTHSQAIALTSIIFLEEKNQPVKKTRKLSAKQIEKKEAEAAAAEKRAVAVARAQKNGFNYNWLVVGGVSLTKRDAFLGTTKNGDSFVKFYVEDVKEGDSWGRDNCFKTTIFIWGATQEFIDNMQDGKFTVRGKKLGDNNTIYNRSISFSVEAYQQDPTFFFEAEQN